MQFISFEDEVMVRLYPVCRLSILLLPFLSIMSLRSETIVLIEDRPIPASLAFGEELNADEIVTWYELEKIASAENRIVLSDCATAGIRDDIARWIPEAGLEFTLKPQSNRRVFLYLDFVGMIDRDMEAIADERRCHPSRRETIFPYTKPGLYEWVEVFVNERRLLIAYQGHDRGFTGPIAVPVSREEFRAGLIHVRIVPSGRLQALWDVFLSHSPPEE